MNNQHDVGVADPVVSNEFKVGNVSFEATLDRVIVEEDVFRSGYECGTCMGSGKLCCGSCQGTGKSRVNPEARCGECKGERSVSCSECNGKGGILVIPEVSERRPTSGKIVSIGPGCTEYSLGDSVLYSNFAGHALDLERLTGEKVVIRILHEKELMCRVSGHLELRTVRNRTEASPG